MDKKNLNWFISLTVSLSILIIILLGIGVNSLIIHFNIKEGEEIASDYANKNIPDAYDHTTTYLGHNGDTYLYYIHFDDNEYAFIDVTNDRAIQLDMGRS